MYIVMFILGMVVSVGVLFICAKVQLNKQKKVRKELENDRNTSRDN